eukprot:TRINITY_DN3998_c1_g1_i10.p2 TRINITY_DN3998_c1_g1~~TRINITY_DN3998_c1_g1_i10.p2  ORF type:complete len:179 (-),score=21.89 TRINITY_DN3998_c1_g1_i10:1173-1709(-)
MINLVARRLSNLALSQSGSQTLAVIGAFKSVSPNLFSNLQRQFHLSSLTLHGNSETQNGEKINVIFITREGEEITVQAAIGQSLLEVAHNNDIDLEGACEGSLACSTCHLIVEQQEMYNQLEEPTDDENDMLDMAFGLQDTSRLGCQIICKKEIDGIRVKIPSATRNFAVDGYVPKPH